MTPPSGEPMLVDTPAGKSDLVSLSAKGVVRED